MTTNADVRSAWSAAVFTDASVTSVTSKIYDRRMDRGGSNKELSLLKHDQDYNWIEYVVSSHLDGGQIGSRRYVFEVRVIVGRELNPDSTNYNEAVDLHSTIHSLAVSGLGSTWNGTVDLWRGQEGELSKDEVEIAKKRILILEQKYIAEKYQ